jgi:hypothetical protein
MIPLVPASFLAASEDAPFCSDYVVEALSMIER